MSTFMGLAWIDLTLGADVDAALAAFYDGMSQLPEESPGFRLQASAAAVQLADGRHRIESTSSGNYSQLADLVVRLTDDTGLVSHAFIALDHDEYGAEHVAVDANDGAARRVYHYFAYPRDDGEYYIEGEPTLVGRVPAIQDPVTNDDPGVLVDGQHARYTLAALYGVPVSAVNHAATADALAHEEIGIVGGPCAHWRNALGLEWPTGWTIN